MAMNFTGGCLCGAVRYECTADAIFMGNCHCRDCQKASGGAYEAASAFQRRHSKLPVTSNITRLKPKAAIP